MAGFKLKHEPMAIMVMGDGTWCSLRGANITIVTPKQYDQLCAGTLDPKDLVNVLDIGFMHSFHTKEDSENGSRNHLQ